MKSFKFEGSGGEYFKIWIVNLLLIIVTFGLYYPWAKVRNIRYFYANTTFAERNFEYHATGMQLFVSFLIAMVVYIIYSFSDSISPYLPSILLIVFFCSVPWMIWRSLKFSLKMTSFSNVHFSFVGTATKAYLYLFVYPLMLVVIVTLMVFSPMFLSGFPIIVSIAMVILMFALFCYLYALVMKKKVSYIINGSCYGQAQFSTVLETTKILIILLKTLLLAIVVFVVGCLVAVILGALSGSLSSLIASMTNVTDKNIVASLTALIIPITFFYLVIILPSMIVVTAYFIALKRAYVFENTVLDNKIHFYSILKAAPLAWVMVTNYFMLICTFGFAYPWTKVRISRLIAQNTLIDSKADFDEFITQSSKKESALGEQMGDAFDVDSSLGF